MAYMLTRLTHCTRMDERSVQDDLLRSWAVNLTDYTTSHSREKASERLGTAAILASNLKKWNS